MKNKKTKLAITIASSALLASTASGAEKPSPNQPENAPPSTLSSAQLATLDKAELKQMLAKIAKEKAPDPKMGAMCYSPAVTPPQMEYLCPTCGEKTIHPVGVAVVYNWEIESCRRLFKDLPQRESMTLDESSFCKKCQPAAKNPELKLIVRFRDGTSQTTVGVNSEDLRLLKAFLAGDLSYSTFNEGKEPLKSSLPRLQKLLGIK